MLLRSELDFLKNLVSPAIARRTPRRPKTPRLQLEALEDRSLPSTFMVLNLKDTGNGSLRQAIQESNRRAGADVIRFADGLTGTIPLRKGPLNITDDLTIEGPGAGMIGISGQEITISPRNAAISGLTIANGGGLSNSGTLTVSGCVIRNSGVGITNFGMLTVTDSSITDSYRGLTNDGTATLSRCIVSRNSGPLEGAGIVNHGTLTVRDSTFSENKTFGYWYYNDRGWPGWEYAPSWGGGIYNRSGSPVIVSGCTFSGNHGDIGAAISTSANMTLINSTVSGNEGLAIDTHWTLTIVNSTITGNTAGIRNDGSGDLRIRNTIIAGNTSYDVNAVLTVSAYNLIGNPTGGIGFTDTDLLGADPLLGPLQDNGGPTFTHALLPGSPAINAGDNTDAPAFDQRGPGFPRIVSGRIDIGAFEVQTAALMTETTNSPERMLPVVSPNTLVAAALDQVFAEDLFFGKKRRRHLR